MPTIWHGAGAYTDVFMIKLRLDCVLAKNNKIAGRTWSSGTGKDAHKALHWYTVAANGGEKSAL